MDLPSSVPQNPADPGHPPAIRRKRARVSEKKRKRARELEQELLFLQAGCRFSGEAELVELLQRAINEAHRIGEATRQSDRDNVLKALENWEAIETDDLIDETGLSRWVLDQILHEFELKKLIKQLPVRDPAGEGGRPRAVWSLIHSAP
jgi:DprA/Smf-like nucleotide binding protein involved in DNA uptake